ncbi:putative exported domain protein [Yersinia pestis]|nr:putative exported domain protein [Yersinia pestis]
MTRMQRWPNRCSQIVKTTATNLPMEEAAPVMQAIFLPMIRFTGQLKPRYCAFRQFIPPVVIRFPLARKR